MVCGAEYPSDSGALLTPGTGNQTISLSSPREGRRNVAAYGEPLLSKERQDLMLVWADGFSKEEANPRGAAEAAEICVPGAGAAAAAFSALRRLCRLPPSPSLPPGPSSPAPR